MGRTDGRRRARRARSLSSKPTAAAAECGRTDKRASCASGPTWLSWGSSDPHALTRVTPACTGPLPYYAGALAARALSSFPSIDKAEQNREREREGEGEGEGERTCSKFFPTGLPGERPEGSGSGGGSGSGRNRPTHAALAGSYTEEREGSLETGATVALNAYI